MKLQKLTLGSIAFWDGSVWPSDAAANPESDEASDEVAHEAPDETSDESSYEIPHQGPDETPDRAARG